MEIPASPLPLLLVSASLSVLLAGCGKERIESTYPNGKPKVIRTYGLFGGATRDNLVRERKFYFNAHLESDARYRRGRLHGRYREFWHNGQKRAVGAYRDGKKEGDWESYYNQFTLSSKGRFLDDAKDGPWNSFWENGALKSQGTYAAGKETGTWKDWTAKGEPVSENSCFEANPEGRFTSYHANKTVKEEYGCRRGVPSGPFVKKDADGTVVEKGSFDAQGRKDGTWEAFYAEGKRASVMHFRGGLDQDSAYAWDEAGRLKERAHFDSGTGERLAYDSLGHLIERRHFLKGRPDGESWTYWPQGGKRALLLYKDGKPATMQKWHPNGRPMADGVFADGHRTGEWKDWWENGTLKEVSHFQDGALHGERFFYDEKGKLLRTQKYEHGFPSTGKIPKGLAGRINMEGPARAADTSAAQERASGARPARMETDDKVRIRLHNLSGSPLTDVRVRFPSDSARFEFIGAGGYSAYMVVDSAYRYAFIKATSGGKDWFCQPVDYVGEPILAPGRYTYALSQVKARNPEAKMGFFVLELIAE
ncbi:MAG TPA: hypothetical protein VJ385_02320 [Fibrobacteria bacterium]|nr:hypothetical protein [Fibrobacteria bacterium]